MGRVCLSTTYGYCDAEVHNRARVSFDRRGVQCMQFERTTGTSAVISQRLTLEAGAIPSSRCVRLLAMDVAPAVLPVCDIAAPAFHDDIADRGVACHGLPCSGQRPPNMLNTLSHVAAIMPRIFKDGFMPSLTPSVRACDRHVPYATPHRHRHTPCTHFKTCRASARCPHQCESRV